MVDLNKQYDEVAKQRSEIIKEMKELEETDILKKYFDLKKQNEELFSEQVMLYRNKKMDEYSACNHILVYSKIDYDRYEGRTYKSCGCIKCGLDNSVLDEEHDYLSGTQKIMYDYLKNNYLSSDYGGVHTEILCDMDLAQAIYAKIKEANPFIDDDTAIKYFRYAIECIRNIKVSDERKESRAKRLTLQPDFNKWDSNAVIND